MGSLRLQYLRDPVALFGFSLRVNCLSSNKLNDKVRIIYLFGKRGAARVPTFSRQRTTANICSIKKIKYAAYAQWAQRCIAHTPRWL